jgi:phosphoribosyl 1,2-cyclic phosphate phosphodiesterase
MTAYLRVTVLGCGSSGGVPRVDGDWGACDPANPLNRRTRCSLLLQGRAALAPTTTDVLIDTSPDLRQQLLAAGQSRLDAIVYTHDHADQAHGIDDVRALAYRAGARIPTFMDKVTRETLRRRFDYCFETPAGSSYPPILEDVGLIEVGVPFSIDGPGGQMTLEPLAQSHGDVGSLGFRIGRFAYSNDCVGLPPETMDRLHGLDVWIVDALRWKPHPSHAHVEMTLAWIAALKPRRTILTNMHIDLDHSDLLARLPRGVEPAHDGLVVELDLG